MIIFYIVFLISFLYLLYYFYTRFYSIFATYTCLTNGNLTSCFRKQPKNCKNIDKNSIYGFCYDSDYYGVGVGEERGPYGYNCNDWIFDKDDCYPETCELANTSNRFGWCVERNRSYMGNSCGPSKSYGITCKEWIWNDINKCPKKCPIISKSASKVNKKIFNKKKTLPKCPIKKCDIDRCLCD
jgi:hypothetical protein